VSVIGSVVGYVFDVEHCCPSSFVVM
jgi:hypothetical protein